MIDSTEIGYKCLFAIKSASWFPYKTGNLKFSATRGEVYNAHTFVITFDSVVAPYIPYLEEGTNPHDIPRAFGRPLPFGIGGRFNGKFNHGSTKHQGFIKNKSVQTIINLITEQYGGFAVEE